MAYTVSTISAKSPAKMRGPVCPACGGLECLCRPRFFAGQLLTEEDLNRLDHYIVEKNKLHNRYLHGWGVVCGLEVLCHPCEGQVTVKSGYALSPCGDDIVLCEDDIVNVCDLIQRCRERERLDCEPPRPAGTTECQDAVEQWVLTVCFTEKPSRGVTALRGSSEPPCCSRCSCGGSSGCGCGCHESAVSQKKPATAGLSTRSLSTDALRGFQRAGRDLCEPTVTCESHYFSLYKAPVSDPRKERDLGAMVQRFENCVKGLFAVEPALPGNIEQVQEWCCQLKENWLDFFTDHPIHDCLALERLSLFVCPAPSPNQTPAQYRVAVLVQLAPILGEYLRSCLCSALLPPCPDPASDNCVPLATITIRKRDCKILRVCNWTSRKFVTTFPDLQYWFSFLPFVRNLRQAIERACCRPFRKIDSTGVAAGARVDKRFVAFRRAAMEVNPEQEFSRVVLNAVVNRDRTIDAQTLFLGAMELEDDNHQPLATDAELRNPLQYLLLNQLAAPLIQNAIPEETAGPLRTALANISRIASAPGVPTAEMQELRSQVEELRRVVQDQQTHINELRERLGNP
ncbi:MAG TPA: hypothetical protein VGK77_28100 [Candidatus Binatia bacterium]